MAIGAIELATIARSQDYSTIKHNENNKPVIDQSNISGQVQKEVEQKTKQVQDADKSDWHSKKFDAKEKGSGQYEGNGGKQRRKGTAPQNPDGRVTVKKGQNSFDIKI